MKKNKVVGLGTLALAGVLAFTGCGGIKDEEGKAWAEENGYVKDTAKWAADNGYVKAEDYNINAEVDTMTSATSIGQGGLNYGDVDWSEALIKEAIKEYLKGDNGNYREMYSVATSYNNKPSIANVEYVLNTETFELFGGSEKNTEKLNIMQQNPNVSLYWTRQLREEDVTDSYFESYGVEIEGTVKFYDYANLTGAERTKFIETARNYFKTMGAQYVTFYQEGVQGYKTDDQLIQYFANAGTVYYSIVPTKITITSPYMLFAVYNGTNFNTPGLYENEFLSEDFLMDLLTYVRTAKNDNNLAQLTAINYSTGASSGLKTQATLNFNN